MRSGRGRCRLRTRSTGPAQPDSGGVARARPRAPGAVQDAAALDIRGRTPDDAIGEDPEVQTGQTVRDGPACDLMNRLRATRTWRPGRRTMRLSAVRSR